MDFYLRSGDRLVIDSAARGDPDSVRPGDIVAYLDWADSPLVSVHRVLWKFRGADGSLRFRTKGDGNLWFDQAIGGAQVLGRVSGVKRSGLPGFEPGRLGGLFAAAYSYAAVLLLRLLEAAGGWLHLAVCLAAAAASRLSFCPPLLRGLLPAALEAGLFCDPNLRTWPRALFSALPGLLARLAPAAELPACAAPAGKFLSGEVRGRLELSGDVTIGGDVTVMPGASLVLLPGVQVRFARAKSDNGRALRAYAGGLLKFRNDKLCRILVYGEFVCAGTAAAPVRLGAADDKWDCLVFLGRSCGTLENAVFSGLAAPLRAMDFSRVKLDKVVFGGGPSALVAAEGCSRVRLTGMELGRASFPLAAGGLARLAVRNCSFTGSATSILVSGLARARLTACRFGGFSAHAVLARDGASVLSSGGACSGGNLPFFGAGQCVMRLRGLSVKGASGSGVTFRGRSLKLSACKVRDCGGGVLLAGKQALLAGSVFSHNRSFAAEVSSGDLAADNCVFETCLSGPAVSFAGRRLDLRVCELRDCTAGLSFSGKTAFISGSVLSGNSGAALQAFHGRLRLSATAARDCAVGLKAGGGAVLTAQELTLERMRSHGVQAEGAASVTVAGGTIDSCGGSAVRAGAGAKVELTGVSLKNCVAGLSLAAGAAAGVERAEILAMVSGAELTGKSRLRLDGSLMRGCAAGVRAENGSLFEAAGFTLEQVKSHGVQAASGARVRLNGAKINSCGGSGVEITGGSGARLAGLEVSGCSVGLSQTGGRAGIKDSRMADIK
ncbi:MAG: right-handed parallel beta-helix repeat-containing protein, partial [Elusimicrobiales bacterium]|nr:right-handed parallel beta-helix repeat-containing protein [Elusimicrobiales bacterium]